MNVKLFTSHSVDSLFNYFLSTCLQRSLYMTIKQSDNLSENEWIRILQIVDLHASVSYNYWHLNVLYKLCVYYVGPYLIVITKREKIGDIDGRTVWKVVSTEVLSFKRTLLHLTEQQVCNIKLFIYLSRIYVKSNYVNSCNYQSSSNMFNIFNWSKMLALRILLFYINLLIFKNRVILQINKPHILFLFFYIFFYNYYGFELYAYL